MKRNTFFLLLLFVFFSLSSVNLFAEKAEELNTQGVELSNQNKFDQAQEKFDQAVEQYDTTAARALHNKAYVLEIQGNILEAMNTYQKAIDRNPDQVDSIERLGFWFYKSGKYVEAVSLGEKVLKLDPENKDVVKWLPDAYKLKLENPPKPEKKDIPEVEEEKENIEEQNKSLAEQAEEEKKEIKVPYFMVALDAGLRVAYDLDGKKYPYYVSSPGAVINAPYKLHGWYKAGKNFNLSYKISHPFYGATIPNVVSQEEFAEARFSLGNFTLGGGIQLSHYNDDFVFDKQLSLHDYKLGGVFQYAGEEGTTEIVLYPKYLPPDTKPTTIKDESFDTSFIQIKHTYVATDTLSYYSRVSSNGFYFYDHKNTVSNYWGYVEIGLGFILDNKNNIDARSVSLLLEFNKRFIYQSLDNEKPYSFFNGQGFLGFDSGKQEGSYFASYFDSSSVVRIQAKESIDDSFFIYQDFEMEIVGIKFTRHEFLIKAGAGLLL